MDTTSGTNTPDDNISGSDTPQENAPSGNTAPDSTPSGSAGSSSAPDGENANTEMPAPPRAESIPQDAPVDGGAGVGSDTTNNTGTAGSATSGGGSGRQIRRSTENKMLGGVCGGIADYFDVDVTLVRLITVVFTMMAGFGLPLYAAAWLVVPAQGADRSEIEKLLNRAGSGEGSGNNNTLVLAAVVIIGLMIAM